MRRHRYYFDGIEVGAISVYETAKSFAEADHYGWTVHHSLNVLDFGEHSHMTSAKKVIVSQFEFEPKGTKFQKWIRNRVSEVRIDGTFIISFMPIIHQKPFKDFIIAGMMFIPELEPTKWHFEGNPKDASSLAFLATKLLRKDSANIYNHTDYEKLRHILMTSVK